MYHFAVVALLGLATLKVVDLLEDIVPSLTKFHTLVTFALAIAACVAGDYSLFRGFGIALREDWMGVWATGFMVGSMATVWKVAFGWLGSNEGAEPDVKHPSRPRMAA